MKIKFLLSLAVFAFSFSLISAQNSGIQPIKNVDYTFHAKGPSQSFIAQTDQARVSVEDFFATYQTAFGLTMDDTFIIRKEETDKYNWTHYRMQQYHQGFKVLGGEFILHSKNGFVEKANGKLALTINAPMSRGIVAAEAIEAAIEYVPAERYMWDIPEEEALLKKIKKNTAATHYPSPELVLLDKDYPNHSGKYLLAYVMDIYAEQPVKKERVFVEAYSGHIIQSFNTMDHTTVSTVANTRYNGEQNIMSDSVETDLFILRDSSRGDGIFIQNDNPCSDSNLFLDSDNYWNNYNEYQDEVAPDALFALESAYDYFLTNYDKSSYDNGSAITCRVHYGNNYNNASWNGSTINLGDGDGERFNPLTCLDIVVHEYMHAVTEYTAALVYREESGALNEAYSDVFAKIVEKEYLPHKFSWSLGKDALVDSTKNLRVMDNPHLVNMPEMYKGQYWSSNGAVHTNSAVFNYWFTLLCDGKKGVNEIGNAFDVPMLGFEKMSKICYRMLTVYLTSTSNYHDAVSASIQAMQDVCGADSSTELYALIEAWHAVGLADLLQPNDLSLLPDVLEPLYCAVVDLPVTAEVINNDATMFIPQGTIIDFYYQANTQTEVHEQYVLPTDLRPLERFTYTFMEGLTIMDYGEIELTIRIDYPNDPNLTNNEETLVFEHRNIDDIDIDLFRPTIRRDNCGFYEEKRFSFFMSYDRCEMLEEGYIVPVKIEVDGEEFTTEVVLESNNINGSYISFAIDMPEGITGSGEKEFRCTMDVENDTNFNDNLDILIATLYPPFEIGFIKDFTDPDIDWSANIDDSFNSDYTIEYFNGDAKLVATGYDVDNLAWFNEGCEDDIVEIFRLNSHLVTAVPICIDLAEYEDPILEFDLTQTRGSVDYASFDVNTAFTVMARVSASPVGSTSNSVISDYIINPTMGEEYHHEVDLSSLPQEPYIMEIELFAISAEEGIMNGDNNIIDNIKIKGTVGDTVSVKEIEEIQPINIYPNPTDDLFYIEALDQKTLTNFVLFDNTGKIVLQKNINETNFSLGSNLSAGVYYLRVESADSVDYMKLIKL